MLVRKFQTTFIFEGCPAEKKAIFKLVRHQLWWKSRTECLFSSTFSRCESLRIHVEPCVCSEIPAALQFGSAEQRWVAIELGKKTKDHYHPLPSNLEREVHKKRARELQKLRTSYFAQPVAQNAKASKTRQMPHLDSPPQMYPKKLTLSWARKMKGQFYCHWQSSRAQYIQNHVKGSINSSVNQEFSTSRIQWELQNQKLQLQLSASNLMMHQQNITEHWDFCASRGQMPVNFT